MQKSFAYLRVNFTLLLLLAAFLSVNAQENHNLASGLTGTVEMQTSLSNGNTPLWLNANKYGLSSLDESNGYLRIKAERKIENDAQRNWGIGYGADVAAAYGFETPVVLQQLYLKARWKPLSITVGQKEEPMNLKPDELSTGSQTLGINARPVPGIRLAIDDYWNIPGLKQWLGVKGHFFYGMATDGGFQEDFVKDAHPTNKYYLYTKNMLLHTKAGFLRFGSTEHPMTVEAGAEMVTQFGGTSHSPDGSIYSKNDKSAGAFLRAIYGGKSAPQFGEMYYSGEGNILGSWMLRINYDKPSFYIGVYAEHFFEDTSQLIHRDYDGYGTGSEWDVKKDKRYIFYPIKDMMAGVEVKLKNFRPVNHLVVEYVGSKHQSGPIIHEHSPNIPDHIAGRDDYMNHTTYMSWSHWGQMMGNALYRSPLYNNDGSLKTEYNRNISWHVGISGDPTDRIHYRLLSTWQKSWGTYEVPTEAMERNYSVLAEAGYSFGGKLDGLQVNGAFGMDHGKIRGNNVGGQITLRWSKLFCK